MRKICYVILLIMPLLSFSQEEDSLAREREGQHFSFSGQLSGWAQYGPDVDMDFRLGARYVPQLNYKIPFSEEKNLLLDFEASANLFGDVGFCLFDTASVDKNIKAYRAWVRLSSQRAELRFGLQKINFGSATIFRPLMWFDRLDPRDPLQMTDGVYGLLARYYFQNNTNLWFWALYGNHHTKGYELLSTDKQYPESGMRTQFPVKRGEIAGSYHFRVANTELLKDFGILEETAAIGEHKIGFDMKFDLIVGLWLEASWTTFNRRLFSYTNQEMITLGMDYTFGVGNGLNLVFEQMLYSNDESPFAFSNTASFSGLSMSYPVGMFDNLSAMFYYDWINKNTYSLLSWQKDFKAITFHLIAYWNPKQYILPGSNLDNNRFSGKGLQLILLWNY